MTVMCNATICNKDTNSVMGLSMIAIQVHYHLMKPMMTAMDMSLYNRSKWMVGSSSVTGGDDCDDTNASHNEELQWYLTMTEMVLVILPGFTVCVPPPNGYVLDGTDCDDSNGASYPNATEICDGFVNDCLNNNLPLEEIDDDGDGYVECTISGNNWNGSLGILGGDDCDDADSSSNPDADDVCDGIDNDCNGSIDDDSAFYGSDALCAADNCLDIINQDPNVQDGSYWVDPTNVCS